jgi:membrane-associated protease RseP (regulator of RpoE activity)
MELADLAVNLTIAIVLSLMLGAHFDLSQVAQLEQVQSTFVGRLAAANMTLFILNLIPAFPMDGGRVLRAALATVLRYTTATRWRLGSARRDLPRGNALLDRAFEMLRGSGASDQKSRANACARAMRLEPNR